MKTAGAVLVGWGLVLTPLLGATGKECLDLSASLDHGVSSPSGVQVTVTAYNRCEESVHAPASWFRVTVVGGGNVELGSRTGRFQTTIAPRERGETKLFIECDSDRARSLRVSAE